ncbi:MAG: DUF2127 domain-containing protein [Candidatus Dormibacteria bacterium]
MRRLGRWLRWEFGRKIEVTGVIKFIIAERFVKSGLLVLGGIVLLVYGETHDIHRFAVQLQDQLNLAQGKSFFKDTIENLAVKFGLLSPTKQNLVASGAMVYGALEAGEGVGLLLRRRWAEYLVLLATAAFLPLEITEVIHHISPFKAGGLVVNLAICGYLVWKKRLFLEYPGEREKPPIPDDSERAPQASEA